jgi:rhodanese-related sulfurtransferase
MKKLFLLLTVLFLGLATQAQTVVKNVDALTFKKLIDEKKAVLIDLRTTEEIERKGMIKGAIQIDYLAKDSEKEIEKLDKKKTYLIYCAGGGRSGQCAELMTSLGFKEVVNLAKGYGEWVQKGLETTKK